MRLKTFLKDKIIFIMLGLFITVFSAVLLYMVNAQLFFTLFIPCVYLAGCVITLTVEFIRKNNYYKTLHGTLEALDQKYLLSEIINDSNFYEGKMLYDILKTSHKSMNDEIAKHRLSSAEYREYIELWVHEIKTPIAGAKLISENIGSSSLLDTLQRIDRYVEQALFYSRSNTVEKDFLIKQAELEELVSAVLRKNAKHLIDNKISVDITGVSGVVFTDAKWIDFIFWQILDNSIKYEGKKIKIYSEQNQSSISLFICDNGIGISEQDISRVFEKGFTGESGRNYAKATGLGLYLCKKLCLKLGLNISLRSKQGKGSTAEIVFPKSEIHSSLHK